MANDPRNGQPGDALDDFLARQQAGGSGDMPPLPNGSEPAKPQSQPSGLANHLQQHMGAQGASDHARIGMMGALSWALGKERAMSYGTYGAEGRLLLLALAVPAAIGRRVWGPRPAKPDPRRVAAHERYDELAALKQAGVTVKPKDWGKASMMVQWAEIFALLGETFGPLGKVLKWALIAVLWLMFLEMEISLITTNPPVVRLVFGFPFALLLAWLVWWLGHKRAKYNAKLGIRGTFDWLFRGGPLGEQSAPPSGVADSIAKGSYARYLAANDPQTGADQAAGAGRGGRPGDARPVSRWSGRGGPRG